MTAGSCTALDFQGYLKKRPSYQAPSVHFCLPPANQQIHTWLDDSTFNCCRESCVLCSGSAKLIAPVISLLFSPWILHDSRAETNRFIGFSCSVLISHTQTLFLFAVAFIVITISLWYNEKCKHVGTSANKLLNPLKRMHKLFLGFKKLKKQQKVAKAKNTIFHVWKKFQTQPKEKQKIAHISK